METERERVEALEDLRELAAAQFQSMGQEGMAEAMAERPPAEVSDTAADEALRVLRDENRKHKRLRADQAVACD